MKLLAKLGLVTLLGTSATLLYAAPDVVIGAVGSQLAEVMMRAQQIHDQITNDARHVQHLRQVAHNQKDVIKLNCVNDKLVQMRPQLNMADRAQGELLGGGGGTSSIQAMVQSAEIIRHLREEADQCIGEPLLGSESTNSFTHPDIYDPTGTSPWGATFEPPVYASPMN